MANATTNTGFVPQASKNGPAWSNIFATAADAVVGTSTTLAITPAVEGVTYNTVNNTLFSRGALNKTATNGISLGSGSTAAQNATVIGAGASGSTNSIAIGVSATAGSAASVAIGANSAVNNGLGVAIGIKAKVGNGSVAVGYGSYAIGSTDIVIGESANSNGGLVLGYNAQGTTSGSGVNAIIFGNNTSGTGILIGHNTFAVNTTTSIVIGNNTSTLGDDTIMIGNTSACDVSNSVIIGNGIDTSAWGLTASSVVIGKSPMTFAHGPYDGVQITSQYAVLSACYVSTFGSFLDWGEKANPCYFYMNNANNLYVNQGSLSLFLGTLM